MLDLYENEAHTLQAEDVTDEIEALHERAEGLNDLARVDEANAPRLRQEAAALVRQAAAVRSEIEEGI